MLNLKIFINSLLLVTTPSLLLYPQDHLPRTTFQVKTVNFEEPPQKHLVNTHLVSYDEIMHLLDDLESGELEKKANSSDLDKINQFLALLAKEGLLSNGSNGLALEEDIEDLLNGEDNPYEYAFSYGMDRDYIIVPAIFANQHEIVLCKSWAQKQWKKTKKFVKKHKKEIIIGAAVVVAAVIIVVVIAASTAGAAAAAAAGAAGAAASGSGKDEKSEPSLKEVPPSISLIPNQGAPVLEETPLLKAAIEEHISSFKEFMSEDRLIQQLDPSQGWDDLSFGEKARECGAYLAHQAFEEISELANVIPELCEEIKDLGSRLLPGSLSLPHENGFTSSPSDNYGNVITTGHKTIDKAFSSDQADRFTEGHDATDPMNNFALGMLPLPGSLPKIFSNPSKLIENGFALDRAGFTKAGRGLMKHGYREGSVFPKPFGNPAQINEQGQKMLESIVNHPKRQIIHKHMRNFGEVIDIHAPGIGGVRYNASGEMIGFLEPIR